MFRASALKLCLLIHWFVLLLPVKLAHLDLLLTIPSQSESHTLTQKQSNVCAGLGQRSTAELFPVPSTSFGDEGTKPTQPSRLRPATDSHRGTAKVPSISFTLFPVVPHIWFTVVFWTFSEHFRGTDHSLLLSVSQLLTSYLSMQGLFPSHYGCVESLLETKAFAPPLCVQASLAASYRYHYKRLLKLSSEQSYTSHSCSVTHHFQ